MRGRRLCSTRLATIALALPAVPLITSCGALWGFDELSGASDIADSSVVDDSSDLIEATNDGGSATLDARDPPRGCSWCAEQRVAGCWDFDCVDSAAGPLLHGGLSPYVLDGGEIGLTTGISKPNAFRSTLSAVPGATAMLAALFMVASKERLVAFDTIGMGCTRSSQKWLGLAELIFHTGSGNQLFAAVLALDPTNNLVGVAINKEAGTQNSSVLGQLSAAWSRIAIGASRVGASVTITMRIDGAERWATSITTTALETRVAVNLGLQPERTTAGDVQSCVFAFDNFTVDFPP